MLRATQNVQALGNSTTPQDPSFFIDFSTNGRNPNPPERLGWGNDGAPLRDFALVAIVQHAPKSLTRMVGVDFRVPTDEELDALVAYQLPLGRQEDFDLPSLELKSTLARTGKTLYLDSGNLLEPGHKNCNGCHFNGGGTAGMSFNSRTPGFPRIDGSPRGFNIAVATNVNETPLALALGLPRDGGFGQILTVFGSFGNTDDLPAPFGHLELEEFNSPPVVESADTGPFFHNHTISDLESAVAFYGTPAFQTSIPGRNQIGGMQVQISPDPDDPEVQAIAAFPTSAERVGKHPFIHQCGGARTHDDNRRRHAGIGPAIAGRNNRRDAGSVKRRLGERSGRWPPIRSRATACCQSGARGGAGSRGSAGDCEPVECRRTQPARGANGFGRPSQFAAVVPQLSTLYSGSSASDDARRDQNGKR